jgi:hypothetical protein
MGGGWLCCGRVEGDGGCMHEGGAFSFSFLGLGCEYFKTKTTISWAGERVR